MTQKPKVLIVGAGIGGLFLALILDKAGINYEIFERANAIKKLGAAMALNPNILPAVEQMGLLEELINISYRGHSMEIYTEDLNKIGQAGPIDTEKIGYETWFYSRPDFHELLVSKIPKEKIHFGKRVLTVGQSQYGAILRCTDGTQYEGDIIIGADGAHSAVRTSLYERLAKEGKLPKNDSEAMNVGYGCLVGTTSPLDPEKYPILKDDRTHFAVVLADNQPHSWTIISVPGNRLCYAVMTQLPSNGNSVAQRNSEWGESNDTALAPIMNHKVPFGGTLGDLINATPKDLVSNVYLEEKIFKTWSHGRIALLGDACHKMLPSAGQGAVNAMQDAIAIANCLYEIDSFSQENIEAAFKEYKSQRYKHAKFQVGNSADVGRILYGQTWVDKFLRKLVFGYMPKWIEYSNAMKAASYRPQISFLPPAPNRGSVKVSPHIQSEKYLREKAKEKDEKPEEATAIAI